MQTTVTVSTVPTFASRYFSSSGHRMHASTAGSAGEGPPVILIHGFPESWYSWRHQLGALSNAGHRAFAVDVRGYGRSAKPTDIEAYAMTALVGDVIALIDDLDAEQAIIVGHDWGAPIAWNTALLRPDRVRGVAGLSVPYTARSSTPPLAKLRELSGADQFYIDYFQEPGLVEAEVDRDLEGWLRGFYFTISGEADFSAPPVGLVPRGQELRARLQYPEADQMAWMTDDDFAFYLGEFERTGLTGGFNRYRNIDRDWTELAPWHHAPVTVPALFIGGERDGVTLLGQSAIDRFPTSLPRLVRSEILPQCGHWIQQERPDLTNRLLLDFVDAVATDS